MTEAFDFAREFAGGIEGPAGAWRFIRDFAEHWVAPLSNDDGWSDADLDAAEERLGVSLPIVLREAYRLFGRRRDLTSNHDVLLGPAELYLDDRKEAVVFRHENQGAASWGILVTDLADPDPAVFIRADLADKQAETWEAWLDRLSLTFVEIILSESLHAPEDRCDFLDMLDEAALESLERHYSPLPFPAYPLGEEPPGIRWFLGSDALLRDDDGMCLMVRARTEEALDQVRDLMPGDWLNDWR